MSRVHHAADRDATDVRRQLGAPSVATGATPHMVHDTCCCGLR